MHPPYSSSHTGSESHPEQSQIQVRTSHISTQQSSCSNKQDTGTWQEWPRKTLHWHIMRKEISRYRERKEPVLPGFSPLEETFGERSRAHLSSHGDFRKHRTRLSKALLETRRDLHLITSDTRHYREKEKTSSISPSMYEDDPHYAWVLLLIAERHTMHSLELKSLLEPSGERKAPTRRLMVSKLKKAVATCRKLVAVIKGESNIFKKLEFYVYAALISGVYAEAQKHWVQAIDAFSIARCGLEALCGKAQRHEESFERFLCSPGRRLSSGLAKDLISTLVEPSLRLALSQDPAHDSSPGLKHFSRRHARKSPVPWLAPCMAMVKSLHPDLFKDLEEGIPKDIQWRTHEAHIYDDELAQQLHELQKKPYDSKISLRCWTSLVDMHDSELARSEDMDDAEKAQDGAIVMTYLKYHMLFSRIKANLMYVDIPSLPGCNGHSVLWQQADASNLLSSMISTIKEISELPGVHNDDELSQGLQQMTRIFGAKRAMALANAYVIASKFPEALKLLLHVEQQMSCLKEDSIVEAFPFGVVSREYVQNLNASLRQRLTEVHIMAELQLRESRRSQHVTENIHQFPYIDGVYRMTDVDQDAKIQPVLCNAVLFDVAYNYIGYSEAVERGANAVSAGEQTDKRGAFLAFSNLRFAGTATRSEVHEESTRDSDG